MTPRILKNYNAVANGTSLQGMIDSIELPDIEVILEEFRLGGMDSEDDADMGLKKMVAKLSVTDPAPFLMKLVGISGTASANITVRGSFVRDSDNTRVAVVAQLVGRLRKMSSGKWEAGKKSAFDYEMSVNYYNLTVGGDSIYEIDVENMIRRIGGVDVLAGIRSDIGLA